LRDIYGVDASATLISRITDRIMPELNEWQSRPLSEVYPVVFFDGINFKVKKDGKVINKCVYSVLGIDMDGKKDILGIWISETESASFWTVVFNRDRKISAAQRAVFRIAKNHESLKTEVLKIF